MQHHRRNSGVNSLHKLFERKSLGIDGKSVAFSCGLCDKIMVKYISLHCLIAIISFIYWLLTLNWFGGHACFLCWGTKSMRWHVRWVIWLFVSICILHLITSGTGVSVQVHSPVSHPVLEGHLWDGGGAVQGQHPGAFPVHPLCPESGQPQLRESCLHTG